LTRNIQFTAFTQTSIRPEENLMDAFDVFHKLIGHKSKVDSSLVEEDELAMKSSLTMIPGFGYSKLRGISLILEGNYSFRNSSESKVSVIRFVPQVTFKGYLIPRVTSSIWFYNNSLNLSTDWRYNKFAAIDFGLGSNSSELIFNNYEQSYVKIHQTLAHEIKPGVLIGIGYYFDEHNGISRLEKELNTSESAYDISKKSISSGLVVNLLIDTRINENFPVGGESFAAISFVQNLKKIGSSNNYETVTIDLRKYIKVSENEMNVLAFRSLNWFTFNGEAPYFDLPFSQGDILNSSLRPYVEGRFRGTSMLYLESEYRFVLTKNELLGASIFANASSFSELNSNQFEHVNLGYGFSGRMKINKKSNVYFIGSLGFGTRGGKGLFFSLGDVF
jgi:hypothetical protein